VRNPYDFLIVTLAWFFVRPRSYACASRAGRTDSGYCGNISLASGRRLGNVEGGNERSHAFQLALLRDSRFTAVASDILVEFGNALYQDVADRFVRGEDAFFSCAAAPINVNQRNGDHRSP
jgi:hypothetical protein